eukprot:scaffold38322_cov191-Amphora_coffeaeformis.AAC.2
MEVSVHALTGYGTTPGLEPHFYEEESILARTLFQASLNEKTTDSSAHPSVIAKHSTGSACHFRTGT